MSISELREWATYLQQEPTNSVEIQLALLSSIAANMLGGKSKIDDMLITSYKPKRDEEVLFASEDDIARALMALAVQ